MRKKICAAVTAGLIALSSFGVVNAASRDEIAAIQVKTAMDFQYWNENSPTKQKIIEFVEDVTNPYSQNYIPPEDRIATFDMDGTFYCETAPIYFQEAMFLYRVLEDKNYTAPKKLTALAKKIQPKVYNKEKLTPAESKAYFEGLTKAYEGMTPEEYRAYVRNFMNDNESGLTNLKRGEAFYLPMVEIISYLTNNGFNVYIDSACGVDTTRELVNGVIPIQFDRILASDFNFTSTGITGKDNPYRNIAKAYQRLEKAYKGVSEITNTEDLRRYSRQCDYLLSAQQSFSAALHGSTVTQIDNALRHESDIDKIKLVIGIK